MACHTLSVEEAKRQGKCHYISLVPSHSKMQVEFRCTHLTTLLKSQMILLNFSSFLAVYSEREGMTTSAQLLHPNVYEQCEGASNECDQLLLNVMPQTVHSSGGVT